MVPCKLYIVILNIFWLQQVLSASNFGIFDVTTILRPPQYDHEGRLEVHTRTNALDLLTNLTDYYDPAATFYPPNFNCNIQNKTNFGCAGWEFFNAEALSSFNYYDPLLAGSSVVKILYHVIDADTKAYNFRYQWPENTTRAYLSFTPRRIAKDDFFIGFCDQIGLLTDQRHYCSGLTITFTPFEGFFYQNQSFWLYPKYDEFEDTMNGEAKFNIITKSEVLVAPGFTWGSANETYTIMVENDNNKGCVWVPNSPKQCFIQSDGILMVSTNITKGMRMRTTPPVLKLDEGNATFSHTVVSPEFVGRNLSSVCISLRYFLDENFSADIKLLAKDTTNAVVAESPSYKIVGRTSPNTKRFTMGLPQILERASWRLSIEVKSVGDFLIRSINGCLPSDGNIYYVPLQPQDEEFLQNLSNYDDSNFSIEAVPLNLRWMAPEYGFDVNHELNTVVSPLSKSTPSPSEFLFCFADYSAGCDSLLNIFTAKGCYNGGVPYRGGCKCLPGFRGPYCESACPPDRFGADCRGHCSVTDHSGCQGKQLAAPGEKFECARGFTGPSCNTDCGVGFYGPDCRLRCGKCNTGTCDRFSGHCNSPCQQGYRLALCQDRFDFNDEPPTVTQVGFDFVEGFIRFMYNRNLFTGYPYYKIQYKKQEETSWKGVLVQKQNYSHFVDVFRLNKLSPATQYQLRVVLVHNSGESYEGPELPTTEILTLCNHCDISDLVVLPEDKQIKVSWKIVEKQFNCPRQRLELEIHMASLAKPLLYKIPPDATTYTIDSILPRSRGSVRLRSITTLGEIKYFPFVDFYRPVLDHITNLSVAEQGSRAIVLQWSTEENLDEARFHIEYQCRTLICPDTHCPPGRLKNITGDRVSVQNLIPFSQYIFSVDNHSVAAMTTADLPSEAPLQHPTPIISLQSTVVWIQWLDPRCDGVHGIHKGFRIELRQGNTVVNTTDEYSSHSYGFTNLKPSTFYEAYIFVVNNKGWNPSKYLRISFTTMRAQ